MRTYLWFSKNKLLIITLPCCTNILTLHIVNLFVHHPYLSKIVLRHSGRSKARSVFSSINISSREYWTEGSWGGVRGSVFSTLEPLIITGSGSLISENKKYQWKQHVCSYSDLPHNSGEQKMCGKKGWTVNQGFYPTDEMIS